MDKEIIIGIPLRDFDDPMTRLSNKLSLNERIQLLKQMFVNIVESFENESVDILCITRDSLVIEYCKEIGIQPFVSKSKGLSHETSEFINSNNNYLCWTICHGDLPYLTKYYANNWINECLKNEILISESKDSGTPIIGGKEFINSFQYGENSYIKHTDFFKKEKIQYKKVFHKELTFELDDPEDYKELLKNKPRWFKKLSQS